MSKEKKSFILHHDSLGVFDKLDDVQLARLMRAIKHYQLTGSLPEMDILTEVAITPFVNQFIRDNAEYEVTREKNSKNGALGGRPKKTQTNPEEPKKPSGLSGLNKKPRKADSDSVSDNGSDSDKEISPADLYSEFIELMRKYTGRKFRGDAPSRKSFATRIKDGYTMADFEAALKNVQIDDFHKGSGYKYITPEFITREDKLTKFMVEVNTEVMHQVIPQNGKTQDAPRTFEKISDEER